MKKLIAVLALVMGLSGCSPLSVEGYTANQPVFDPRDFFNGQLKAEGVVLSRSGDLKRYFSADIEAEWGETSGTLKEVFYWNDGERQHRNWHFNLGRDGQWLGTAEDVSGEAELHFAGNAIHIRYPLEVPMGGRIVTLTMDDWLFQVSDAVIINKTRISKFGVKLGEVLLTIRKN